ncbi:MAG TPA: DUF1592 domain-containing protein [Gemmataceae bacterium]|nr:DUF1592 domain-containing protein [Gemmataceae bacterium]
MTRKITTAIVLIIVAIALVILGSHRVFRQREATVAAEPPKKPVVSAQDQLDQRFATQIHPFLERYCFTCHGSKKPKGDFDLTRYSSVSAIKANAKQWELVLERLEAQEMPPADAEKKPTAEERAAIASWIHDLQKFEAEKNAGDPGIVLARRLSNAEFDYTIRDLTDVDIRPTKEFPVDPANEAGFDNSGESLAMSPALLKKYLAAARFVADHLVLKPEGFVFAPYPVVTDTDRDKYCVTRIIDFYQRHQVDYADYFLAIWRFQHRETVGKPQATLEDFASEMHLSPRYAALVLSVLSSREQAPGPLGKVQSQWGDFPADGQREADAKREAQKLRDLVLMLRRDLVPKIEKLQAKGISQGSQPFVLWRNDQLAALHMRYRGEAKGDLAEALQKFCRVFPDAFVITERAPFYDPGSSPNGRFLSAGFHLMHGLYRDDGPLYDLALNDAERKEIDTLWAELHFITLDPMRQFKDFIFFERAEPPRYIIDTEFDFARSEDKDAISEAKMKRLAEAYLVKARKLGAKGEAEKAIENYFAKISAQIRQVEKAHLAAEPSHLQALLRFAERACRRPLSQAERDDLLAFYYQLRQQDELSHEDAIRDCIASVLVSPHFCYRLPSGPPIAMGGLSAIPLSDYELASRLSYFLWSSMPDPELLAHAAAGDLHQPDVLLAQTRRMLHDPKVRGLATEFAANWLDIRRFEEHNAVDRERFPSFTNELRHAMFEEPIRYFLDIVMRNRSVLDLIYGNDTFVNALLAKHYGIKGSDEPRASATGGHDDWHHIPDARPYGRGGLLPMAVFLTKNAPGLRTSPVKRGYWVVRRVLGERIPPPPPSVPELPKDEASLGELTLPQLLARHRDNPSCSGCHRRFDSVGLVFEGFGPIGERRSNDLGGKPVQTIALFPDSKEREGLEGLRDYLRERRQDDFVDNLCKKFFTYALGRSLLATDKKTLEEMKSRLGAEGYAFGSLVEVIVMSPQFRNKKTAAVHDE